MTTTQYDDIPDEPQDPPRCDDGEVTDDVVGDPLRCKGVHGHDGECWA